VPELAHSAAKRLVEPGYRNVIVRKETDIRAGRKGRYLTASS
jgi:hypothetical protein